MKTVGGVLYTAAELVRIASILLFPLMPTKMREIRAVFGLDDSSLKLDSARTWFDLERLDGGTRLTWRLETDYGFNVLGRFFGLAFAGIVRRDHEAGLVRLGDLAESLPAADFSDLEIEQLVVEAADIAFLPTTSIPEPAAISEAMGDAYFEILSFIDRQGLAEAGAPLSIARSFSGSQLLFDAAIPVRGITADTPRNGPRVRIGTTYAGNVIRVRHVGPYQGLGATPAAPATRGHVRLRDR